MNGITYKRRLKRWFPLGDMYRLEERYGIQLVRSTNGSLGEVYMYILSFNTISKATAMLLDIELAEYLY